MFPWFATTLRQYPEIAIFHRSCSRLLLWQVHFQRDRTGIGHGHAAGWRPGWTIGYHDRNSAEGHRLLNVPVCCGLRGWAAVCARRCERRLAPGHLRGSPMHFLSCGACGNRARWPGMTWDTPRVFIRGRRRFQQPWAFPPTLSIARVAAGKKPNACSTQCR